MRVLLEVTDLDKGETRFITVSGGAEVPDLIGGYALRYARLIAGLPTEATPQRLALFPGEEDAPEDDAA